MGTTHQPQYPPPPSRHSSGTLSKDVLVVDVFRLARLVLFSARIAPM